MTFNNFDLEKLITLVQQRPSIYNYKDEQHSNRYVQEKLWNEISNIMKAPANECKIKWTMLQNSFSRQLHKLNKMSSWSGASSKKIKWYLFDNMLFLSDYILQHEKMENNLSSSYTDQFENNSFVDKPVVSNLEDIQETIEQEVLSQTINTDDGNNEKSSYEPVFKKPKKNRKKSHTERVMELMLELIKTTTQSKNNIEDTLELSFLKSIIPDYLKLNVKNQRKFKKTVINTIDQLLDSQEDNTQYSNEMPQYNNAPHTVISLLSPDQQFIVNNQLQQLNTVQYNTSSPESSSSESSSS